MTLVRMNAVAAKPALGTRLADLATEVLSNADDMIEVDSIN